MHSLLKSQRDLFGFNRGKWRTAISVINFLNVISQPIGLLDSIIFSV